MIAIDERELTQLVERFNRDGYLHIRGVLSNDQVRAFRDSLDRLFDDPKTAIGDYRYGDFILHRLFELDPIFVDALKFAPMLRIVKAIVGADCHVISNGALRNGAGQALDEFHVDDFLWLPLPSEIPRHDARMRFPNFAVNVHYALSDVLDTSFGPLQVVPGSHFAGREPSDLSWPIFEGREPVSVLVRAGDAYLQHPQVWHRGAPNTSGVVRYNFGMAWGMRFVAQRFYPFLNYRVPDHVLKGADETLLAALGKHRKGAYG